MYGNHFQTAAGGDVSGTLSVLPGALPTSFAFHSTDGSEVVVGNGGGWTDNNGVYEPWSIGGTLDLPSNALIQADTLHSTIMDIANGNVYVSGVYTNNLLDLQEATWLLQTGEVIDLQDPLFSIVDQEFFPTGVGQSTPLLWTLSNGPQIC